MQFTEEALVGLFVCFYLYSLSKKDWSFYYFGGVFGVLTSSLVLCLWLGVV